MSPDKPEVHAAIGRRIVGNVRIVLEIIEKFLSFYQSLIAGAQTPPTNPTNTTDRSDPGSSGLSGLSCVWCAGLRACGFYPGGRATGCSSRDRRPAALFRPMSNASGYATTARNSLNLRVLPGLFRVRVIRTTSRVFGGRLELEGQDAGHGTA
jgi:hypothetical protein